MFGDVVFTFVKCVEIELKVTFLRLQIFSNSGAGLNFPKYLKFVISKGPPLHTFAYLSCFEIHRVLRYGYTAGLPRLIPT